LATPTPATAAPGAALNSNPQITDFAVYAQNSAALWDRATVSGGDLGVRLAGTGPFLVSGYELALASQAQVATTRNVIANRVQLLDRARVGDVQANQLANQSGFTVHRYPFPSAMPALPPTAPVSPGSAALTVNASSTFSAFPGAYGAASIGYRGVLRLYGGVYHLVSLQLDNEARIEAMAPVQVRVAGRFGAFDRVWIGPAAGATLTAGDLRIEVSGRNGSSGSLADSPKAAAFGNDSTIHGVMLVPTGTLQTGHHMAMVGAYVGRDVLLDIDSAVTYQSGVGPSGCLQSCDDGNPCTTDICSVGVCVHTSSPAGTSCADGNACNGAETCDGASHCRAGTPISCAPLDQCHLTGVCNPASGLCSNPAKPNGTPCSDGNLCTKTDVCTAGACGGTAYACDDGLGCTADACNGDGTCTFSVTAANCLVNGLCYAGGATSPTNHCQQCTPETSQTTWSQKPSGASCNDGNACTANDVCNGAGQCGGTAYTCSDGLACTADTCNGDGTCTFAPMPGTCAINGACYGAGASSPADQCQQCTPDTSQSVWSSKTDGTACDDGKAESQGDACTAGVCQGTIPCASVADVRVGVQFSCALRTDASLWCWGANSAGQLGNGTTTDSLIPVRAGATTWNWTSVIAGGYHGCGIRRDGTLWCWGYNAHGQLGNGSTDGTSTPTQVAGQDWVMVRAGIGHTCGVQGNGSLWCWGDNQFGGLGNGTQSDSAVPVEVVGMDWVSVAAGAWHTCGIKADHSLWCWGHNADGQLGNGTTEESLTPVQVGGAAWSNVSAGVATGAFHT